MPYITKLIAEGEHEQLDFKHSIDNMRKIAKSLVAFANTKGGRLLIGVKDNGSIKGCRPQEEKHMLDFAAESYCEPKIELDYIEHNINGKLVLEAIIMENDFKNHLAISEDNSKKAFVRVDDEVLPMPAIMFLANAYKRSDKSNIFQYNQLEKDILNFLSEETSSSISMISKELNINKFRLNKTLAKLLNFEILTLTYQNKVWYLQLNDLD